MDKIKQKCIQLAKTLPEWFTKTAIENMKSDIITNKLLIEGDLDGFLIYKSNKNKAQILWMGVRKELQREGIGKN